jgi:hypothetical protein
MRAPDPVGNLDPVDDAIGPSPQDLPLRERLYGGTLLWVVASLALGWLPLLWINNWTPPNLWASVLLITLFVALGVVTFGWWFLIGWHFALTARMRTNALVLGALLGAVGIIIESSVQWSGPFGATGGDDPGIGYLFAMPAIPVIIAIPMLMFLATGYYLHAFRASRR